MPAGATQPPRPVPLITAAKGRATTAADVLKWLAAAARPLASPDASEQDIAPLVTALGDARIVRIGEITHGTHEDLAFKSSLSRAMVRAGITDRIVFEFNRRIGERRDRFIAPGSTERDTPEAMREAKVYQVWMTHEVADLRPGSSTTTQRNGQAPGAYRRRGRAGYVRGSS